MRRRPTFARQGGPEQARSGRRTPRREAHRPTLIRPSAGRSRTTGSPSRSPFRAPLASSAMPCPHCRPSPCHVVCHTPPACVVRPRRRQRLAPWMSNDRRHCDRDPGAREALQGDDRSRGPHHDRAARRGLRIPWSQRRGQDDCRQAAARPRPAHGRSGRRAGPPAAGSATCRSSSATSRGCALAKFSPLIASWRACPPTAGRARSRPSWSSSG